MEPLRKIDPTPRLLEPPTCDDSRLWDLWLSRLHLPALVVADELGLFAFIAENPATADEVAHSFSLSKRGAESLLGVLAGLDFLRKVSGRFHLTNLSREYLLPNSPYYWGGVLAAFRTAPSRYSPQNMLQSLREDPKAKERRVSHAWKTGSISSDQAQQITAYMHAHSFASAFGLARWAQLDTASRLLDVGAGSGCFSIALALRHEHLSCTLLAYPKFVR